jgi:hypothetical protein
MHDIIINEMNSLVCDQCYWTTKSGEDAFITEFGCHYIYVYL